MPKVDTTLTQLSGTTVFSKFDANSVFWQIPPACQVIQAAIYLHYTFWMVLL